MLYSLLKIWVRLAAKIFFNKIIVNKPSFLREKGPLLIAANHPNSFLDAILLDILFEQPVWSLARGDVFKKPLYIRLLTKIKILPVYRTREGVENLEENYKTFEACKTIFKNNGLVLIFSEGLCVNEWHLRPLKKGTARLAISAWQENIPLRVLPAGINYSSFKRIGKNVIINFGNMLTVASVDMQTADGKRNLSFNEALQNELKQLVYEIKPGDIEQQKKIFSNALPVWNKLFLWPFAPIGFIVNAPLYLLVKSIIIKRVKEPGHFDSLMLGLLVLLYPFYLLLIVLLLWLAGLGWYGLVMLFLAPFSAWAFIKVKSRF